MLISGILTAPGCPVRNLKLEQCKRNCFAVSFWILSIKFPYFKGWFASSQFSEESYWEFLFL